MRHALNYFFLKQTLPCITETDQYWVFLSELWPKAPMMRGICCRCHHCANVEDKRRNAPQYSAIQTDDIKHLPEPASGTARLVACNVQTSLWTPVAQKPTWGCLNLHLEATQAGKGMRRAEQKVLPILCAVGKVHLFVIPKSLTAGGRFVCERLSVHQQRARRHVR